MISLYESLQQAYHFTDIDSAISICKDDEFTCSWDDGRNDKGFYYMSLSRTKSSMTGYPVGMMNDKLVRFILDYDKLRSKYKIKPLDFTSQKGLAIKSNWSDKDAFDRNWSNKEFRGQPGVECEERVYVSQSSIKDFHKYIIELQVDLSKVSSYQLNLLKKYCRDNSINLKMLGSRNFKYGK